MDYISSTSSEGVSVVHVQYINKLKDYDRAVDALQTELNKVNDLPEDANDPYIIKIVPSKLSPVVNVVLSGDFTSERLIDIADELKTELERVKDIGDVDIPAKRDPIVRVELSPEKILEYGLTTDQVITAIKYHNSNLPGGKIKDGSKEFFTKTVGKFKDAEDIADIPLLSDTKSVLFLKDIATITSTLEDENILNRENGKRSIIIQCKKKTEGNIVKIVASVKKVSEKFVNKYPSLNLSFRNDASQNVKDTINVLKNNAIFGIIMVALLLFVLIGWENAILAAIGIPFTFFMTFFNYEFYRDYN